MQSLKLKIKKLNLKIFQSKSNFFPKWKTINSGLWMRGYSTEENRIESMQKEMNEMKLRIENLEKMLSSNLKSNNNESIKNTPEMEIINFTKETNKKLFDSHDDVKEIMGSKSKVDRFFFSTIKKIFENNASTLNEIPQKLAVKIEKIPRYDFLIKQYLKNLDTKKLHNILFNKFDSDQRRKVVEIAIQTTNKLNLDFLRKEYPAIYQNTVTNLKKSIQEKINETDFVSLVDKHFLEKVHVINLERNVFLFFLLTFFFFF